MEKSLNKNSSITPLDNLMKNCYMPKLNWYQAGENYRVLVYSNIKR